MQLYLKAYEHMLNSFKGSEINITHHEGVVKWIKELKPDADESFLIAGILHDIERAIHGDWKKGSIDPDVFKKHCQLSADEAERFLKQGEADKDLIEKVKHLIINHEAGGDEDQDIINDADALSFFENNIPYFMKVKMKEVGKEVVEKKIQNSWNRIKSDKAKKLAKPMYDDAINKLNKKDPL